MKGSRWIVCTAGYLRFPQTRLIITLFLFSFTLLARDSVGASEAWGRSKPEIDPSGAPAASLEWFWQNPLPQGNSLFGVDAVDLTTATAVGGHGTILRTTDGGSTWTPQSSGTNNTLRMVTFTDALVGTAVGDAGTILRTTNGGDTWVSQVSGTTVDLRGVSFTDYSNGTAVGAGGTILRTTDGGSTWVPRPSGTTEDLYDVSFTDPLHGVVVGKGGIFRTTDGGSSWEVKRTAAFRSVAFLDSLTGFVLSYAGNTVGRTTDGGTTFAWTQLGDAMTRISFVDELTGAMVGNYYPWDYCYDLEAYRSVYWTTDGGVTWHYRQLGNSPAHGVTDISPIDAMTAVAVGRGGEIDRTTDGGQNWTPQTSTSIAGRGIHDVCFIDALTGIAVGTGGTILRTTDGGATWVNEPWRSSSLLGVAFFDSLSGIIVGDRYCGQGLIYWTTDGGGTWSSASFPWDSPIYDVCFTSAFIAVAVASGGKVLRTLDGGATWDFLPSGTTARLLGVSFIDPFVGTVVGENGVILRTTDGGNSWRAQSSDTSLRLNDVCFTGTLTGTVVGNSGIVLRTENGGSTWEKIGVHTTADLNGVAFADEFAGVIVGDGGKVFLTTDGGLTWEALPSGTDNDLRAVSIADGETVTAVGEYATIIQAAWTVPRWTLSFDRSQWTENDTLTVVPDDSVCTMVTIAPPQAGAVIDFAVDGANLVVGSEITDADGRATFCYPVSAVGADRIIASATLDGDKGPETVSDTLALHLAPPRIDLTLVGHTGGDSVFVAPGDEICARAEFNTAAAGLDVTFEVSGSTVGSGVTDGSGAVTLCYPVSGPGVDSIVATSTFEYPSETHATSDAVALFLLRPTIALSVTGYADGDTVRVHPGDNICGNVAFDAEISWPVDFAIEGANPDTTSGETNAGIWYWCKELYATGIDTIFASALFDYPNGSLTESDTCTLFVEMIPDFVTFLIADETKQGVRLVWNIIPGDYAKGFNIYRSADQTKPGELVNTEGMLGPDVDEYLDEGAWRGESFTYTLGVVMADDSEMREWTTTINIMTLPLALLQNYPNPFNSSTHIRFTLPERKHVVLEIFDVQGRHVRTLVNDTLDDGYQVYDWDSNDSRGNRVGSSVYFYRLTTDGSTLTKKMVLLR